MLRFLWAACRAIGRFTLYGTSGFGALLSVFGIIYRLGQNDVSAPAPAVLSTAQPDTKPHQIDFRDAIISGKELADRNAFVRIAGVYVGLGALNMLYAPTHAPLSADAQSIDLMVDDDDKETRSLFYDCQTRADALASSGNFTRNACPIVITGHMGECYLKIAPSATMPCLHVERVERVGSR